MNPPALTQNLSHWLKIRLTFQPFQKPIHFDVPHDVFSTQQIDEGTRLLLNHLPDRMPQQVLDMGCGYGALSLPLAAHYSESQFDLVDRDLLAVAFAHRNAQLNQLSKVKALGSLGFQNVPLKQYDWILCNMPARIGKPVMEDFLNHGLSRLSPLGEIRIVVIHDVCPIIETIALPLFKVARGEKHTIYALKFQDNHHYKPMGLHELYLRDRVQFLSMEFLRPFDLGGDDPKRLKSGLPVLIDGFPRQYAVDAKLNILSCHPGYGIAPIVAAKRWPHANIFTWDRDLLGLEFTRLNAENLGVKPFTSLGETDLLLHLSHHPTPTTFDFIFAELSPSAGQNVAHYHVSLIAQSLAPKGTGIVLCGEKNIPVVPQIRLERVLSRDGYILFRIYPLK
jgi:16S rRNA G1207 methylase RsmC